GEHVFHHPDLPVVVEWEIDVRARDEVQGQAPAARAAHREPDRRVGRGEEHEGGGKDGTRLLLRVAEEAPRPLPRPDPAGRELAELACEGLEPRRHEVEERSVAEAEWRPV